jgi:hypothetical protein
VFKSSLAVLFGEEAIVLFLVGERFGDIPVLVGFLRFMGLPLFLLVFGELSFSFSMPAV